MEGKKARPIYYDARLFRFEAVKERFPWAEEPVVVGYQGGAAMDYGHPLHRQLQEAFERFEMVEVLGLRFEVVACDWDLTFSTSRVIFYLCTRGDPWENRRN